MSGDCHPAVVPFQYCKGAITWRWIGRNRTRGLCARRYRTDFSSWCTTDSTSCLASGLCAAVMRPNPVRGLTLGAAELEPFYDACEANDIPLLLHEGTHTHVETAGASRFASHFAQHACSHPMEAMMAFLSLLEAGVFERHPRLRVSLLESGCGFLPYWLWRLDEMEFEQVSNELGDRIHQRPSQWGRAHALWHRLSPYRPRPRHPRPAVCPRCCLESCGAARCGLGQPCPLAGPLATPLGIREVFLTFSTRARYFGIYTKPSPIGWFRHADGGVAPHQRRRPIPS